MDSICVGGTFHCSSDNKWHSSWYQIHQLICIQPPSIHSLLSLFSSVFLLRSSSIVSEAFLSGTFPFLIKDSRPKDSASLQSSQRRSLSRCYWITLSVFCLIIKNTSYCWRIGGSFWRRMALSCYRQAPRLLRSLLLRLTLNRITTSVSSGVGAVQFKSLCQVEIWWTAFGPPGLKLNELLLVAKKGAIVMIWGGELMGKKKEESVDCVQERCDDCTYMFNLF